MLRQLKQYKKTIPNINKKAFSLVEMIVVVAIIGVMAAIAVPSYDSYMVRGRQAVAKTQLSSAYAAETAFMLSSGFYTGCLGSIGYNIVGDRHYLLGFSPGYEGSSVAPTNTVIGACDPVATGGQLANQTFFVASHFIPSAARPNAVAAVNIPTDSGVSNKEFLVYAVGTPGIRDAADYDYWSIDHHKSLVQSNATGTHSLGGASWATPGGW